MTNFQTSLDKVTNNMNKFNEELEIINKSLQQSADQLNAINTEIQFNIEQLRHQVEEDDRENAINQMSTHFNI